MVRSKKIEIFFEERGGEGPLAIYLLKGPYGDAIQANNGRGVGFFDQTGKLIAVQFDLVNAKKDKQKIEFQNGTSVEINVQKSKVRIASAKTTPDASSAA